MTDQRPSPSDPTDATDVADATEPEHSDGPDPSGDADYPEDAAIEAARADSRLARGLAIGAIVIALVAVGLTAWRLVSPATASCQSTAWGATPSVTDLPAGWSIGGTQFEVDRMQMTLLGPAPQGQTSARAVVYATVTCFPTGAADAVTKSQAAATAAGQTVTSRTDLGEQGFTALDPSGATFVQFRHGDVVAYMAASGDATAAEAEAVASAFDRALGGAGPQVVTGSSAPSTGVAAPPSGAVSTTAPSPSDAGSIASAAPSPVPSAAAPELEAVLPTSVAGTALSMESAVGTSVLGTDAGSRAITAALRAAGKSPDDLRVAQAYDPTSSVDLSILALRGVGMKGDALRKIVLDTWLAANGSGVTTSTVTLGGQPFLKVDYGDGGSVSYVTTRGDIVIVIETADAKIAAEAAAALR